MIRKKTSKGEQDHDTNKATPICKVCDDGERHFYPDCPIVEAAKVQKQRKRGVAGGSAAAALPTQYEVSAAAAAAHHDRVLKVLEDREYHIAC